MNVLKNTKIVCTIGPACEDQATIEKMVRSGMDCVRLNFSHGSYDEFAKIIRIVHKVSQKFKTPIAIIADLQGPKIRVGEMPEKGINLQKNTNIILTTKKVIGTTERIPVQYGDFPKDVGKHDHILIDDGMIELRVKLVANSEIFCEVINGGTVLNNKGINVPTASISANPITTKDKRDLLFSIARDVDYVALSFVKSAKNIIELRELIKLHQGKIKIIAKIERHEAVENLESIVKEADGLMVARGDLGVEIAAEKVPLIQKKIIHLANIYGKPVILATQILQSMVENPRPTRAEISDAANAVFDHCDALMLSNETATGKYPVAATKTLAKVASGVEHELKKHGSYIANRLFQHDMPVVFGTCFNGVKLALDIGASLIVTITYSGFTAEQTAKHRSYIPIVAITEDQKVRRELALVWGINHVLVTKINMTNHTDQVRKLLLKNRLAKKGDKIVIISNASMEEKYIATIRI